MANYNVTKLEPYSDYATASFSFSKNCSFDGISDYTVTGVDIKINYHGDSGSTSPYAFLTGITMGSYSQTYSRATSDRSSVSIRNISVTGVKNISVIGEVRVGWSYVYLDSIKYTVYYQAEASSTITKPISGEEIPKTLSYEFTWNNLCPVGTIASQKLFWKYSAEASYTQIPLSVDALSYTFSANTFTNGTINWYVSFTDSAGNIVNSSVQTVKVGITPSGAILSYPVDCNIRIANQQIFTWELSEPISTGQKSYELRYKKVGATSYTTLSVTSANQYHKFNANTFETASYVWGIRITNNDDVTTDWYDAAFIGVGSTQAPNITNITNSVIPTVTWTISSQDTFELEIFAGTERLYTSGVQVGENVRSFTPNIILDDGNYIIKMRAMNQYGYFTEWMNYSFVLNTTKPDALTCYVYANEEHGVTIAQSLGFTNTLQPSTSTSSTPNAIYVLRKIYGADKWDIIGKLSTSDSTVKYTDNTIMTGVKYEYALRNYKEEAGYTDSNVVVITVDHVGSIIYNGNKYVVLYKTEDQQIDISHSATKKYSYSFTIGRKYPVRESSEWVSQSMSISCFVDFEQYEMLESFYEGNDDLWFKGNNFSYQCSIDSISIKETLWGKGYTLDLKISRTDEEEFKLF